MQPLSHDIRLYYRKHATGEVVSDTGDVTPTYKVDGPYSLAFRSGGRSRTLGESGYTKETTQLFVIADNVHCFEPGDILTSDKAGENALYQVQVVKDWPTEQTMYVRGL